MKILLLFIALLIITLSSCAPTGPQYWYCEYPARVIIIEGDENMSDMATYTAIGSNGVYHTFRETLGVFNVGDTIRPIKYKRP